MRAKTGGKGAFSQEEIKETPFFFHAVKRKNKEGKGRKEGGERGKKREKARKKSFKKSFKKA